MEEGSTWRSVLSILAVIFIIIRLLFTCSNMNKSTSREIDPVMQNFQNSQQIMQENLIRQREAQKQLSNTVLYSSYQGLDSLSTLQRENFGIRKLEKDSLIYIGLNTQMKILKNYFLQNNHDDSLRIAFKSPDNLTVFIHDFESKGDLVQNLKSLKRGSDFLKHKVENTIGQLKAISYKIKRGNKKYNGYVLCFQAADFQNYYEFESDQLTPATLKIRAIDFFAQNMKETKK